jgi:hypothetical protein
MSIVRAILVAFTALSVAMLPVGGAELRASSPSTSLIAAQSECCPQGQHCEKPTKGGCAKLAGCEFKCSSFSAATLAPSGLTPVLFPSQKSTLVVEWVTSPPHIPPSPPPRV